MFLSMYRGKTTINDVMDLDVRSFMTLLQVRSEELKTQQGQDAEAGEQLQEDMEEAQGG